MVGLWTAASFIETIRDILRRAYGVKFCAPFWEYRLASIAVILAAVVLLMIAFAFSVVLSSAQHAIEHWLPICRTSPMRSTHLPRRPGARPVRHLLHPVLRADAVALPQARLPQMAGRVAHHRLVAGDGRIPAPRRSGCSAATA